MTDIHEGQISALEFVPNEPLMITTGRDNALRVWIFDQSDGSARFLPSFPFLIPIPTH